jgi:uncharacterized protein (DUF2062 family)
VSAWLRRRLIEPLLLLLQQGITPDKLAWSVALGVGIGLIPILGVSTILCTGAALALRLNMPTIQLVNYALSPLQLLLIIPFVRLGEAITRAPRFPITVSGGLELLSRGVWHAVTVLWDAIMHAALGWLLIAPLAIVILHRILRSLLARKAAALSIEKVKS